MNRKCSTYQFDTRLIDSSEGNGPNIEKTQDR
jgi:hypothetical protein